MPLKCSIFIAYLYLLITIAVLPLSSYWGNRSLSWEKPICHWLWSCPFQSILPPAWFFIFLKLPLKTFLKLINIKVFSVVWLCEGFLCTCTHLYFSNIVHSYSLYIYAFLLVNSDISGSGRHWFEMTCVMVYQCRCNKEGTRSWCRCCGDWEMHWFSSGFGSSTTHSKQCTPLSNVFKEFIYFYFIILLFDHVRNRIMMQWYNFNTLVIQKFLCCIILLVENCLL